MAQSKRKIPIPSFIQKLQMILEDNNNHNIITWTPQGDAFIVLNSLELEQTIMPQYFKHQHFTSFLRQLNMYNFQKIRNYNNQSVFWHRNFQRGKEHLMTAMKRNQRKSLPKLESDKKIPTILHQELNELKISLENDKNQLVHILSQHEMILQQHKELFYTLQTQSQDMEYQLDRLTISVQTMLGKWNKFGLNNKSEQMSEYLDIDSNKIEEQKDYNSEIL